MKDYDYILNFSIGKIIDLLDMNNKTDEFNYDSIYVLSKLINSMFVEICKQTKFGAIM